MADFLPRTAPADLVEPKRTIAYASDNNSKMKKKDYIAQVMAFYKELREKGEAPGEDVEIRIREPEKSWEDLVDYATMKGLDNVDMKDLIRMAGYAKDVLR